VHIDPYIAIGSAIVGLLVGMTGAGGGALMTPMLIMVFGVKPSTAISSDLVAAVVMKPVGAAVHLAHRTVNLALVGWLSLGSVPAAFLGAWLLHLLGQTKESQTNIEIVLGVALLLGVAAMLWRAVLDRRSGGRTLDATQITPRPLASILVGIVGGLVVGMTSVGSGSLMIVLLLFVYPAIKAKQLVGTDLTQAVPLTLAAAAGALLFGHVELGLTLSVVIGSVPAVLVGSLFSSRAPDALIRPVIGFAIFASGLKYVGVPTDVLGWILFATIILGGGGWVLAKRPWQSSTPGAEASAI
jgi:uncharacterized membrane protein YfcA